MSEVVKPIPLKYLTANNKFTVSLGVDTSEQSGGYKNMVLQDEPIIYYRFKEPGLVAKDYSGNNLDGVYGNGVAITDDTPIFGSLTSGSLEFVGPDATVAIPNSSLFNSSSITFEGWIRYTAAPATPVWLNIFDPGNIAATQFAVFCETNGLLHILIAGVSHLSTIPIGDDAWHHIVVNYVINNELEIYIDSVSNIIYTGVIYDNDLTELPFATYSKLLGDSNNFVAGAKMSEVAIY